MRLFIIGSEKIVEHLKDFHLTEAGTLPVFDIKKLNDESEVEKEVSEQKNNCCLITSDSSLTYHSFKAFIRNNPGAGIILFSAGMSDQAVKKLVDDRILDKNNLVLAGTRNFTKQEKKFVVDNNIKNYTMREISFEDKREVADSIMSVARQWSKAYMTINLDVLDPAFAPGTNNQKPGGLSTRELLYFIHRLRMLRNVSMHEITGYNQGKDANDLTAKAAAKIIVELS